MAARRYCVALFNNVIIKMAFRNQKLLNEDLCKHGAKGIAMNFTKCKATTKAAYKSSSFTWEHVFHQISFDASGIRYHTNGEEIGMIKQSVIDSVKDMDIPERRLYFGGLTEELDEAESMARKETKIREDKIFDVGRAMDKAKGKAKEKPKVSEEDRKNKEEEEKKKRVFQQFIDGIVEKIPAKTTSAGLKGDSWFHLASQAAEDTLDDYDVRDDQEDGPISFYFLGDSAGEGYEFVLNQTGITFMVNKERFSHKEYDEIITDFMKK